MNEDSSEFRQIDLVKFGKLVVGISFDYEKGFWITLHKLVGNWNHSPDEPKTV